MTFLCLQSCCYNLYLTAVKFYKHAWLVSLIMSELGQGISLWVWSQQLGTNQHTESVNTLWKQSTSDLLPNKKMKIRNWILHKQKRRKNESINFEWNYFWITSIRLMKMKTTCKFYFFCVFCFVLFISFSVSLKWTFELVDWLL